MKKKILIVIVAVAMMIPLLAVGVCADVVGVSVGSIDAVEVIYDSNTNLYSSGYRIIVDSTIFDLQDTGSAVIFSGSFSHTVDVYLYSVDGIFAWSFRTYAITINYDNSKVKIGYYNDYDVPNSREFNFNLVERIAVFDNGYPSNWDVANEYSSSFTVDQIKTTHPFLALIELMFDNFSRIIGGLAAGITGAFTALIWENPEATEKSLSTLAKFIFTIAGLSIGMTVFYLVLRLIRFGRQR